MCGYTAALIGVIMPWRLIVFIAIFGVFLAFITFNLENKCDISFGFKTFKEVPVFLTVFTSFVLGLLCTLPFIFTARRKLRNKARDAADRDKPIDKPEVKPIDKSRDKLWGKLRDKPTVKDKQET